MFKKLLLLPLLFISTFVIAQRVGNLVFTEKDFPNLMNWYQANYACDQLKGNWRLPSKYELNILWEYLDRNNLPITVHKWNPHWSSTSCGWPICDDNNDAWLQHFNLGSQRHFPKNFEAGVVCVRDY